MVPVVANSFKNDPRIHGIYWNLVCHIFVDQEVEICLIMSKNTLKRGDINLSYMKIASSMTVIGKGITSLKRFGLFGHSTSNLCIL